MKKERKDESFIKQPYFTGGEKALKDFVNTHLVYPEMAKVNKIEGDVSLRYEINHKGDVTDVKIIGGIDPSCDEEAIRVVKLLKFVVPKNPRGLKVTFHKNIRIHFRINEAIPLPVQPIQVQEALPNLGQQMQISYTIIPTVKKTDEKSNPKSTPYQYTIKV